MSPQVHDFPRGESISHLKLPDGTVVQVYINWEYIQDLGRRAVTNKTRRSAMGPIVVKAPRH